MHRWWRIVTCSAVVLTAACGASKTVSTPTVPSRTTTSSSTASTGSTTPVASTTTTATTEPLIVSVSVRPDHVFVGTEVTFTVDIRGPGTGNSEDVRFGDGAGSGANAGMINCGDTARADRTGTYTHSYAAPGTYVFTDTVDVIGSPPACAREDVTATATVIVASSMQTASGGEVQSPTGNIACGIYFGANISNPEVHCATFSPPQTADMTVSGTVTTCAGSTCALGNPGFNVPTLGYGAATGVGPFECVSAITGMTCTISGGKGFTISRSRVEQLGP
jgi:hypothetical protein